MKASVEEVTIYFIYLAISLLVCVVIISWLAFNGYNTDHDAARNLVQGKAKREKTFLKKQKEAIVLIDSAYKAIKLFNPAVNAVYADNDIKHQLKNIKSYYLDYTGDVRYRVFYHTVALYSMFLNDKKILQKKQSNVVMFKNELQECQIGFKASKNKMNLKAVEQDDKSPPK